MKHNRQFSVGSADKDLTILRRFDTKCDNFSVFLKNVTISQCFLAQTKQGKRSAPCT